MCMGCWEDAGFPKTVTQQALHCAALAEEVGPFGSFHIVVDDWNIEDTNIRFCLGLPNLTADEIEFGEAMLAASEDERYVALAILDGYLGRDGSVLVAV